jgi:hypothetical protein
VGLAGDRIGRGSHATVGCQSQLAAGPKIDTRAAAAYFLLSTSIYSWEIGPLEFCEIDEKWWCFSLAVYWIAVCLFREVDFSQNNAQRQTTTL